MAAGGGDIDPDRYGAERSPHCGPPNEERDEAELALAAAALDAGLPVLGICRGLQILNVALGGSLHQHLPDLVGHEGHSPEPAGYGTHEVSVAPGSRLASILNRTDLTDHLPVVVPTHHHQAIDALGAGLAASAWATDQTIEAAELDPAQVVAAGEKLEKAGSESSSSSDDDAQPKKGAKPKKKKH